MYKRYILMFFVALLGCKESVDTIYVSSSGNDQNNGTISNPVATIQKAQQLAREIIRKDSDAKIQVILCAGDYYIDETIQLNESDACGSASVSYLSAGDEAVNIYGGIRLTNWEKWNQNIYRVKLADSLLNKDLNVLLEDGEAMPMARYPNKGKGFGGELKRIDNTTVSVPQNWANYDFSHAQVYGWLGSNWFTELRKVMAVDTEKLLLTIDPGSTSFGGLNSRIYIQGVPELLDAEGEWCINKKDGYLYYWPLNNDLSLQDKKIILPVLSRLIEIKGISEDHLAENITFKGLNFIGSNFSSSWKIFKEGEDGSMPEELQEGLIYIENAANVLVENCAIIGAGHSAVYINNKAEKCQIKGCHIKEAGFCGIYANSYFPGSGNYEKPMDSYINKKHVFTNNYIHDCGKYIGGGCGIQLFQSGDNTITHNLIHEMPRYGISYKGVRNGVLVEKFGEDKINYENHFDYIHTRNNYIAYNEIYNVCRSSFDFGAIESWGAGKDNVWDTNAIHDIDQSVEWDGWAHGLFPDDASDYLTVKNNIVYELKGGKATGAIMVKSFNQIVENNIFVDNQIGRALTMAPFAEPAAGNCVRNNIICNSGVDLYDVDKNSFSKGFYGFYENAFNKEYVKGKSVFAEVDKNVIYPHYNQLDSIKEKGWDIGSMVADPLFDKKNSQESVTYWDYQLKENSPAYQLGFKPIEYHKIGLLPDFGFEVLRKRNLSRTIEAESYNRMRGLRPIAATGIYHMESGAWTKYEAVDFSQGDYNQCAIYYLDSKSKKSGTLFELRIDSPSGELIGTVSSTDTVIPVKQVTGIHDLYLVFSQSIGLDSFKFVEIKD